MPIPKNMVKVNGHGLMEGLLIEFKNGIKFGFPRQELFDIRNG